MLFNTGNVEVGIFKNYSCIIFTYELIMNLTIQIVETAFFLCKMGLELVFSRQLAKTILA